MQNYYLAEIVFRTEMSQMKEWCALTHDKIKLRREKHISQTKNDSFWSTPTVL